MMNVRIFLLALGLFATQLGIPNAHAEISSKTRDLAVIAGCGSAALLAEAYYAYQQEQKNGTLAHNERTFGRFLNRRFFNAVWRARDSFEEQAVFNCSLYATGLLLGYKAFERTDPQTTMQNKAAQHRANQIQRAYNQHIEKLRENYPQRATALEELRAYHTDDSSKIMQHILQLPTQASELPAFDQDVFEQKFSTHVKSDVIRTQIMREILLQEKLRSENPDLHLEQPIFCLVGSPGVGKTTISQTIATALGREFAMITLGSKSQEEGMNGWPSSYKSPRIGQICASMIQSGTTNPLILLDEIDKPKKDVSGALLAILDPATNKHYKDAYINVPVDLSQVFFMATANNWDDISKPLQSRLTPIFVPDYTEDEKVDIAQKAFTMTQEFKTQVATKDFLKQLLKYDDEGGVRKTKQLIRRANGAYVAWRHKNSRANPSSFHAVFLAELEEEKKTRTKP